MDKKARPSHVLPTRDPLRSTGAGCESRVEKIFHGRRGSSNYTRTFKMKAIPQDREGPATLLLGGYLKKPKHYSKRRVHSCGHCSVFTGAKACTQLSAQQ